MNLTEEKKEEIAKQLREIIAKNFDKMKLNSLKLTFASSQKARSELQNEIAQAREKNILACVAMANLYLGLPPPKELKIL